MRKLRVVIPAALAFSLAAAPLLTYADEFVAGPGNPYDAATWEKLQDNILEYEEIELLVEEYNQTLKNARETYKKNKNSAKDVVRLKEQIYEGSGALLDVAGNLENNSQLMEPMLGYPGMAGTYAGLVYNAELMNQQAEQMLLSADTLPEISPEMLFIQAVETPKAMLVSSARKLMVSYEQLLLQKENLESTIELLQAVYQSAQTQAAAQMATANDVLSAKQNLEAAQAGMIALDSGLVTIRQNLCTMTGWAYDATPEIMPVPSADLGRIDEINLEADIEKATANNFTLRYNALDYEKKTNGSVEQKNLERLMTRQKDSVATGLTSLYNEILQKRNEYQTAEAALQLEEAKMESASRKFAAGTIGRLEFISQENAYKTKEIAVKTANLELFQAMEDYDWAVKGTLSVPTA